MSKLTKQEHEYFHQLLFLFSGVAEAKFEAGATEHRHKHDLWDISDKQLEQEIQNEIIDLMVYLAEKLRRQSK